MSSDCCSDVLCGIKGLDQFWKGEKSLQRRLWSVVVVGNFGNVGFELSLNEDLE